MTGWTLARLGMRLLCCQPVVIASMQQGFGSDQALSVKKRAGHLAGGFFLYIDLGI